MSKEGMTFEDSHFAYQEMVLKHFPKTYGTAIELDEEISRLKQELKKKEDFINDISETKRTYAEDEIDLKLISLLEDFETNELSQQEVFERIKDLFKPLNHDK